MLAKKVQVRSSEFAELSPYLDQIRQYPPLTREEEQALAKRARRGDKRAQELLTKHNLALVVSVAKKYMGHAVRLEDIIQEGNVGLLKAVERFEPSRGTRFSTYAIWWIRAYVRRFVREQQSAVHVPGDSLGDRPRDLSLEAAMDEDGELTLGDRMASTGPSADEQFLEEELKAGVQQALLAVRKRLGGLGWDIVRWRLSAHDPRTLQEIGERWGLSRERVRQVEQSTKRFLRGYLAKVAA